MDLHLDRPGARIAYSVEGPAESAETLVVTHATTASRAYEDDWGVFDWTPVVAAGHRLVRFDTRGHGDSTGSPSAAQFTWDALADDLLAVAGASSADRPVDALGVSAGCGTVLWAAVQAPDRFRRLVLVIPPPVEAARTEQSAMYRAAAELVELLGLDAWVRAAEALPPVPIVGAGGWVRSPIPAVSASTFTAVLLGDADSELPSDAALAALPHETLVLSWATDASHPVEAAEHIAAQLRSSTLEVATTPDDIRGWGARVAAFLQR